jgi:fatty-acyl-CoA synthase
VVLREDQVGKVSEQDIIHWCHQEMAAYKVPARVEFMETLPRSPTGKLQWRALQDQEWARQAGAETATH